MNLTLIWLIFGAVLCLMELFVPTAFVELAMGLAAFLVAIAAATSILPQFSLQIALWMVLALLLVWLTQRFMPKRSPYTLAEATEAQTLTAIEPGKPGRVLFEGNSWQAKADGDFSIPADTTTIVVGRRGNTLFVVPEDALKSLD